MRVYVRLPEEERGRLESLHSLWITLPDGRVLMPGEFVPVAATERADFYGEDLPVGLRLLGPGENEE